MAGALGLADGRQDPQLADLAAGGFRMLAKVECGAPASGRAALPGLLLERACKLQSDRQQGGDALVLGGVYLYIKCLGDCCAGRPLELHSSGGSVFSGNAFEAHAGRSARKRWRETIRVLPQNVSLKTWLATAARDGAAAEAQERAGGPGPPSTDALVGAVVAAVAAAAAAVASPSQPQPHPPHLQALPEAVRLLEQMLRAAAASQGGPGGSSGDSRGSRAVTLPPLLLPGPGLLQPTAGSAWPAGPAAGQQQQQAAQESAASIAAALLQGLNEQLRSLPDPPAQPGMLPLLQTTAALLRSSQEVQPGQLHAQQSAVGRQQQQQQQQQQQRPVSHMPRASAEGAHEATPAQRIQETCRLSLLEQRVQQQQEAIDSQGAQLARLQEQLQALVLSLLAAGSDMWQGSQGAPQQASTEQERRQQQPAQGSAAEAEAAEAAAALGPRARPGKGGAGQQSAGDGSAAAPAAAATVAARSQPSAGVPASPEARQGMAQLGPPPVTPAGAGTAGRITAASAAALLGSRGSGVSADTNVQLAGEQGSGAAELAAEAAREDGGSRKRARQGGSPKSGACEQLRDGAAGR